MILKEFTIFFVTSIMHFRTVLYGGRIITQNINTKDDTLTLSQIKVI